MSSSRGFTLIEVLLAMAITAVVAALAYSGLDAVLRGVDSVREESESIYRMDRALFTISRDMRQFVDRPVRDEFGALEPSIIGGEAAAYPLSLTRAGWANTNAMARSQLQRVRYLIEEESLWRESWLVLDRATDSEPQRVRLISGVNDFQLEFLANVAGMNIDQMLEEGWVDNWNAATGLDVSRSPLAVRITLDTEAYGLVERLYEIPQF